MDNIQAYEKFVLDYIAMSPENRLKVDPIKIMAALLIASAHKMEQSYEAKNVNALLLSMEAIVKTTMKVEEMLAKILLTALTHRGPQTAPRAQVAGPTHAEDTKPQTPEDKKAEEMLANIFSGLTQPGKA